MGYLIGNLLRRSVRVFHFGFRTSRLRPPTLKAGSSRHLPAASLSSFL
jgi:hypothetical protein